MSVTSCTHGIKGSRSVRGTWGFPVVLLETIVVDKESLNWIFELLGHPKRECYKSIFKTKSFGRSDGLMLTCSFFSFGQVRHKLKKNGVDFENNTVT